MAQIDPLSRIRSTIYNANQQVIANQDAAGFHASVILDPAGRSIASQDARGNLSSTVFDMANRRIASIDALNAISSTLYDLNSNQVQTIDSLNRVRTQVFDALDRAVASVSPLGYSNTVNRDAAGRQISTQNALGAFYTNVFDNDSRHIATVSPLGYRATRIFDAANHQIGSQDSLGFLNSTIWDPAGRPVASVSPLNFMTTAVFDAASQQIATIDALGNRSSTIFAPNGWQLAVQNELGFLTSFIRDAAGQQICIVDANNGRSTTIFSNRGYTLATQDQLGFLTSFTQDANGNGILRVDARNWPTSYTVDALNRVAQTQYIDNTRVTNVWDTAGQQVSSADSTGLTSFVWDLDGRKTTTQNPTGINLTATLDGASNRLVLADAYGRTTYTHDVQSRLTTIQNPLNEVTSIQWDALDREQHRVLGNGGSVSHVYDAEGRETVLQNISAAGVAQAVFTNAYDALANRLSVIELDNTRVSFSYEKTSQIANEQRTGANAYNTTYVWDPLGNRLQEINSGLTTTRTFSPTNSQLTSVPPSGPATTNTWDANGNLAVANTGGALTTNLWDPENRLSHVAFSDGTSESYLTSQDGLRKSKTTGSGTTVYTWDEQNVLLETNTSNVVQARFTDYPGYWGGLSSQNRGGVSSFFLFDSQGSTRVLTSILGVITDGYSFMVFGVELQSGSGTLNDLRYIGKFGYKRERPNVNLARNRRLFSADGQWDRRDPIGLRGRDINLLKYVGNSPVDRIDPSGRIAMIPKSEASWGFGNSPGAANCCSAAFGAWYFRLNPPKAQCDGFIIQEIHFKWTYTGCGKGKPHNVDHEDITYYEAWHYFKGDDTDQDYGAYGLTDTLSFGSEPDKKGQWSQDGVSRFYCEPDVTFGLLIEWGFYDVDKCSKYAGDLPCTSKNAPPVWKQGKEKESGGRKGNGHSCCCDDRKTRTSLTDINHPPDHHKICPPP